MVRSQHRAPPLEPRARRAEATRTWSRWMLAVLCMAGGCLPFDPRLIGSGDAGVEDDVDASTDASADASTDASADASTDASADASADASTDAPDSGRTPPGELAREPLCSTAARFTLVAREADARSIANDELGAAAGAPVDVVATSTTGVEDLAVFRERTLSTETEWGTQCLLYAALTNACSWTTIVRGALRFSAPSAASLDRALLAPFGTSQALVALDESSGGQFFQLNESSARLTPNASISTWLSSRPLRGAALGDVDRDGTLDLLIHGQRLAAIALLGLGPSAPDGVVEIEAPYAARAWLAYVDSDRRLDLLATPDAEMPPEGGWDLANALVRGVLIAGAGDGSFPVQSRVAAGFDALSVDGPVALADFDGDGDADIVQWRVPRDATSARVVDPRVRLELLLNDRDGNFGEPTTLALDGDAVLATDTLRGNVGVADLDLDGHLDVVATAPDGWVVVRGATTHHRFEIRRGQFPPGMSAPSRPRIALADLDRDGDVDVVALARDSDGSIVPMLFENTVGGTRALVLELEGSPVGAEVCVATPNGLPLENTCRGPAETLLGRREVVATTAQREPPNPVFGIPEPHARVDVRVIWPGEQDAQDLHGLEPGYRYSIERPAL